MISQSTRNKCQSRNRPLIVRFLNADSYASTGQGFLGYNMFAYCGNNSVNVVDESGDYPIWISLFEDGDYGFIHRAVQLHIVSKYPGVSKEGRIYNKDGSFCGRADLYKSDGSIWEVKTAKTGSATAELQLSRYCGKGQTIGKNRATTKRGTSGIFPGYFSGSFPLICGDDSYTVFYYTPQPGVVLYWAQKNKQQEELEPFAVYVPKRERSIFNSPSIGIALVNSAVGIGVLGALAYCGGSSRRMLVRE